MTGTTLLMRGDQWDLERLEDGRHRLVFQTGELADRLLKPIITPDEAQAILDDPSQFTPISRRYIPWIGGK